VNANANSRCMLRIQPCNSHSGERRRETVHAQGRNAIDAHAHAHSAGSCMLRIRQKAHAGAVSHPAGVSLTELLDAKRLIKYVCELSHITSLRQP
jgi:hypothetical protein